MRSYSIISLFILIGTTLAAQSSDINQKTSWELSIGISKVGVHTGRGLAFWNLDCFHCDFEILNNGGFELNSMFALNRKINTKNELFLGIGYNYWKYKIDNISNWNLHRKRSELRLNQVYNIVAGHRYIIKKMTGKAIFIENMMLGELHSNSDFNKFNVSVASGLGLTINPNEGLQIISVLSYKQSLLDLTRINLDRDFPYSFGLRIGLRKLIINNKGVNNHGCPY